MSGRAMTGPAIGGPALAIEGLHVASPDGARLVRGVTLHVASGTSLTILGETGSGKTLVADAAMGKLANELSATGRIGVGGVMSDAGDRVARRPHWGRTIAMLPQEPWLALDPTMRAAAQVTEAHRLVRGLDRAAAATAAGTDLAALGLAAAGGRFPHQLSGGMAQRVAFAAARAGGAGVVLADEPTKGLDSHHRDAVAALLLRAVAQGGALLCITHDIAFARALGGDVAVMLDGAVIEHGPAARVLHTPGHAYTRRLLAADPTTWPTATPAAPGPMVLAAEALSVTLGGRTVLHRVDLSVQAGEWLAVTGPSGCGKTTLGNALLGLRPLASGQVRRAAGLTRTRFQKLYQDPVASFAPRRPLRTALAEVAALHRVAWPRVAALLDRLRVGDTLLDRRPDQVSGGELQRVALARALLPDPVFLFADEPTSRLDPVTQQETMAVLHDATRAGGCAVLLVTHDAALARAMAARGLALTATG